MKKLEELFFQIEKSKVMVNNVIISDYYAIVECDDKKNVLGLKKSKQDFIQNENAYDKACEIFKLITGKPGEAFKWWINEKKNRCAILIRGLKVNEYVTNNKKSLTEYLSKKFESLGKKNSKNISESIFIDSNPFNFAYESEFNQFINEALVNLDLLIGVVNGYDLDNNCAFFIIIRWIDDDRKVKYLAVDRANNTENSQYIAEKFEKEFLNFISESFERYLTPIDKKYIRPNLFDLDDKNLSVPSIENDDDLRRKLVDFNINTLNFVKTLNYSNYFAFTEFIIKNNYLFEDDKDELKVYNKDSIISTNQKYKSSINRLKKYYLNEKNRGNYELNNFHRLDNVEYLLHK